LATLVERIGGIILAAAAALTFVSVFMRYLANAPIPDSFDFSRLLISMVILWGIAAASYYGEHIQFELLRSQLGHRGRRVAEVVSTLITMAALGVVTVQLAGVVIESIQNGVTTSGLSIVLWPFYVAAWLGIAFAVLLLAVRVAELVIGRGTEGARRSDPQET
jgi:TRAP-type C4-dicarboxylate transport system permease small subunit